MKKAPFSIFLLSFLLALQSLGGLFGGISLVVSPSGAILQMPQSMLEGSPFNSFLVPGLVLMIVLGIFPGILAWAIVARPKWGKAGFLNIYRPVHWAWTYSVYTGIMLVIWILVEILWIDHDILQTIFGLVGVAIIVAAFLPATMFYAGWNRQK